ASLRERNVRPGLVRSLAAMLEPDPERRATRIAPLLVTLDGPEQRESKRERKRDKRERNREEREQRRRERAIEHTVRRERSGARARFVPWPIRLMFAFGLGVAYAAVLFALGVIVPLVLRTLAIVFGRPLRNAANAVANAGRLARARIARASASDPARPA